MQRHVASCRRNHRRRPPLPPREATGAYLARRRVVRDALRRFRRAATDGDAQRGCRQVAERKRGADLQRIAECGRRYEARRARLDPRWARTVQECAAQLGHLGRRSLHNVLAVVGEGHLAQQRVRLRRPEWPLLPARDPATHEPPQAATGPRAVRQRRVEAVEGARVGVLRRRRRLLAEGRRRELMRRLVVHANPVGVAVAKQECPPRRVLVRRRASLPVEGQQVWRLPASRACGNHNIKGTRTGAHAAGRSSRSR
eukprot:1851900-Prymnesium_polylepis.2